MMMRNPYPNPELHRDLRAATPLSRRIKHRATGCAAFLAAMAFIGMWSTGEWIVQHIVSAIT